MNFVQNWSLSIRRLNSSMSEMIAPAFSAVMRIIKGMNPETVYVITYKTEKTKRTVTGKYVSNDLTEVLILDEKGRFNRVPIDKIIRINFYHQPPF